MNIGSTTSPLCLQVGASSPLTLIHWRQKGVGVLRIVFGIVWGIDAWFKWQPDFQNNVVSYLTKALNGQPSAIHVWITFWIQVVKVNPPLIAHFLALGETAVAIGLILGIFSNVTTIVGTLMALLIWSTAEGFGGPYNAGTTDIGTAIIYAITFIGLFLTSSGLFLGIDQLLTPILGRWGFLAAGSTQRSHK